MGFNGSWLILRLGTRAGLGSAPTDQDETPHSSTFSGGSGYSGKRAANSRPYGGGGNPVGFNGSWLILRLGTRAGLGSAPTA